MFVEKQELLKKKLNFNFFSLSFNADTLQATIQSITIISECLFFLSTTTSLPRRLCGTIVLFRLLFIFGNQFRLFLSFLYKPLYCNCW